MARKQSEARDLGSFFNLKGDVGHWKILIYLSLESNNCYDKRVYLCTTKMRVSMQDVPYLKRKISMNIDQRIDNKFIRLKIKFTHNNYK